MQRFSALLDQEFAQHAGVEFAADARLRDFVRSRLAGLGVDPEQAPEQVLAGYIRELVAAALEEVGVPAEPLSAETPAETLLRVTLAEARDRWGEAALIIGDLVYLPGSPPSAGGKPVAELLAA